MLPSRLPRAAGDRTGIEVPRKAPTCLGCSMGELKGTLLRTLQCGPCGGQAHQLCTGLHEVPLVVGTHEHAEPCGELCQAVPTPHGQPSPTPSSPQPSCPAHPTQGSLALHQGEVLRL